MATFPRTIMPGVVSLPAVPGALVSVGHTGGVQLRSSVRMGRVWTERWSAALRAGSTDTEVLVAFIERHYNVGLTFDVTHPLLPGSGKARNGTGTGSPLVQGANQSGTSLVTDAWGLSQANVMRRGDVFRIANLPQLFRVVGDSDPASNGSGVATIGINPPILAGSSPADNAALTLSNNVLTAMILDYDMPDSAPDEFIAGLRVTFMEAP